MPASGATTAVLVMTMLLELVLSKAEVQRLSTLTGARPLSKVSKDHSVPFRDRNVALVRAFLRLLAASYGALRVLEGLLLLLRTRKFGPAVRATLSRSRASFQTALCISSYPALHRLLRLYLPQYASMSPLVNHGLLSLLSSSITTQLNLYALSGLLAYFLGHKPRNATMQRMQVVAANGGAWWLFPLAQAVLLPVAVFRPEAFPSAWRKLTSAQAKRYLPQRPANLSSGQTWPDPSSTMSLLPLLLSPIPFPSFPLPKGADRAHYGPLLPVLDYANSGHTRAMCAVTHPDQVSCLKNWVGTVGDNTRGTLGWVAAFNAVTMSLRWRKWRDDPQSAALAFATATARYTAFVGMSLSTAWGLLCLLQKLLPNNRLVYARFSLQAAIASLWILLLPSKRRLDLGMYSMRAALLAAWQVTLGKRLQTSRGVNRLLEPLPLTLVLWFLLHRRKTAFARGEDEHSKELKDASYIGRLVTWLDAPDAV